MKIPISVVLSTILLINISLSCKSSDISNIKVINGSVAKGNRYKGVFQVLPLRGSGTFINDRIMVTAAHVVIDNQTFEETQPYILSPINSKKIYATSIFYLEDFPQTYRDYGLGKATIRKFIAKDFSFLVFPKEAKKELGLTKTNYHSIASDEPDMRDDIHIVGFGYSDYNAPSTSGIKRWGANEIDLVTDEFLYFYSRASDNQGTNAKAASGDSGGPVLNKKSEIIGILSVSDSSNTGETRAVNINGGLVKNEFNNLLRKAISYITVEIPEVTEP